MCVVPTLRLYAIDKVKSVQRRFTKRLTGSHDMEYSARLNRLNLQSLEYRRLVVLLGLRNINTHDYLRLD